MAKGVAAITMDEEYQQKRREAMNKQPSGLREGLTRGGKGLVSVRTQTFVDQQKMYICHVFLSVRMYIYNSHSCHLTDLLVRISHRPERGSANRNSAIMKEVLLPANIVVFSFQGFVSGITGIVTKPIKGMLNLTLIQILVTTFCTC